MRKQTQTLWAHLSSMAPKGGTFVFLLILACAAEAMRPAPRPDFKDMAKKLMRKCEDKGYPVPKMEQLRALFNTSDLPADNRNSDQSNSFLPTFMKILRSVSPDKDSPSQVPMDDSDKMKNMMWNCSQLPGMIKLMRNSSEASVCYMHAFVAPLSWAVLAMQKKNNITDSDDYDSLLWAVKPALQDIPTTGMTLPNKVARPNMKKMMKMLLEMFKYMPEQKRTQVAQWAKQQITQNDFNCTTRPSSDQRLSPMEHCKSSLKWLDSEALTMMGPYLSYLTPNDVDASPKEKLCEFFRSTKFKSASKMVTNMNPSLANRFLQRFQECFSGEKEFTENVDKLGTLACNYYAAPEMTPELSRKLLSQLSDCNNPRLKKLKKRLIKAVLSISLTVEILRELGSNIALLPPKQLSAIPNNTLKEILTTLGPTVQWTKGQLYTLVKKQLDNMMCKRVSGKELKALQSIAAGLPSCVLKHVKSQEILNDSEALKNISKHLRKGQLKALLQGLREDAGPSELVQKLNGPLLCSVSLSNLAKANIDSLDQVKDKKWCRAQAAYLAKKLYNPKKKFQYRKLRSVLQGVTCKMIDRVADGDVQDMAQGITETPQWLSKVQAGCAARKLFKTLEKKRADYFKTITEEEMDDIPTILLVHLPPLKVKDLPVSVCPVFLAKMEMANLSLLPLLSPSRLALTKKALFCLANGTDLSRLTTEDVSTLGPLLCELQPSQLRLMVPEVLKSSLQDMASCQHIPRRHRVDLIQLVKQTFGNPSNWSAETMEKLGFLLFLDDNATSALPNKPWMKDVLYSLKSRLSHTPRALKEKIFNLTTTTSIAARKKRAAGSNNSSITGTDSDSNNNKTTVDAKVPTEELIEELGMDNVYWTAAQLGHMSVETFTDTVDTLGSVTNYTADQLAVLSKKATEAFGPMSNMTESEVIQLGCITQGFSNTDLERLPFSLDTLEDIANCSWNESQLEQVWWGVAKYNNLTAKQLGAAEIVALDRFICGLSSSEIGQLNIDAFKDAVGSMGGVWCSYKVTQQLKSLAVSAFGDPSTWTEAEVSDLGNIISGLDATELASLDSSVFSFLSKSCIPLMPPSNFAALSVAQLEDLGPDNAAVVTSEQRFALKEEQLNALDRAMTGVRDRKSTSGESTSESIMESGAPSLSVEGISAFMKPLLVLLTGFLLL